MDRTVINGIIALVIIGAGLLIWQNQRPEETQPATNSSMLESKSDTEIITEQQVTYFEEAKGYFAKPAEDGNYPGIVIVHENRGLRQEIKDTADQLAKAGYLVLAVDLYGQVVETQDEARALSAGFNQETGTKNMQAAVDFLKQQGAEKIGSLGWCFGGRQALELAISGVPLNATVVYYGGNMASTVEQLRPITWPVLGIFGDADTVLPIEKVKEFENSLNELNITNEIYIYPGVGHAFANPSGPNYAQDETRDAWEKTLNFLEANLK